MLDGKILVTIIHFLCVNRSVPETLLRGDIMTVQANFHAIIITHAFHQHSLVLILPFQMAS